MRDLREIVFLNAVAAAIEQCEAEGDVVGAAAFSGLDHVFRGQHVFRGEKALARRVALLARDLAVTPHIARLIILAREQGCDASVAACSDSPGPESIREEVLCAKRKP